MGEALGLSWLLAAWSVIVGLFLGLAYDVFSLPRIAGLNNRVITFFADFIYCLFSACVISVLFFNLSYGRMRAYSIVLIALSMLGWRLSVGRLSRKLLLVVLNAVRRFLTPKIKSIGILIRKIYKRKESENERIETDKN